MMLSSLSVFLLGAVLAQQNLPPAFEAPTPMAAGTSRVTRVVCVGGTVSFTVRAKDTLVTLTNKVEISFSGVPVGAVVGQNTYPNGASDQSLVERTFAYTPGHTDSSPPASHTVCFTAKDNNNGASTGEQTSSEKCVYMELVFYPKFIEPTLAHDTVKQIYVGQQITFEVAASDANDGDSVSIMLNEDPGMPNGAVINRQQCMGTGKGVCNPVKRKFQWTPVYGQQGTCPNGVKSYRVCVHARDNKDTCTYGGYFNPEKRCVIINVRAPDERWVDNTPAQDYVFKAYVSRTMRGGDRPLEHKECELCYTMTVKDNNNYYKSKFISWTTSVNPDAPATGSKVYPYKPLDAVGSYTTERDALPSDPATSYGSQFHEHKHLNAQGQLTPNAANNANGRAYVSPTNNHLIVGDLPHHANLAEPLPASDLRAAKKFCWKPVRGQEARTYRTCYTASDVYGCHVITRCVKVEVVRCKYCTQPGESLLNIGIDYNTDWLQLWGVNVDVKNPDHLYDFQLLNLGPVYQVRSGDSLADLADRFHTTVDEILSVNPDINQVTGDGKGHNLKLGQPLCILPGICTFTDYHLGRD